MNTLEALAMIVVGVIWFVGMVYLRVLVRHGK